jgi:hypothetical protein
MSYPAHSTQPDSQPSSQQASSAPVYAPAPPPQYQPYNPMPYVTSAGTNGLAVASLVLGILWIYWIGSILAVIFGHVALAQIDKRNQSGKGLAIAGLVLGWVGVGMFLLFMVVGLAANA